MPIYEYECDGCHKVFEVRQKVSDPMPSSHSCGSTKVRRILSATSFVLKGTGWYATDYGNRKEAAKSADTPKAAAQPGGPSPSGEGHGPKAQEPRNAAQEAPPKAAAPPAASTQGSPKTPSS